MSNREFIEGEEMQLFEDVNLTRPATKIDWGRPDVGSHNEVVLYLANFSREFHLSNIKATENDSDIHIEHPTAIKPDSAAKVTITWNPKLTRRKELDVTHLLTGELWIG
jgi:hypothetical protein